MRGYTSTVFRKRQHREMRIRMDAYIETGVHGDGCIQIPNDTLKSSGGRKIGKERRMLPMDDTGNDEILVIIRDIFNVLPLGGWSS